MHVPEPDPHGRRPVARSKRLGLLAVPPLALAWLALVYTPQVNASLATVKAFERLRAAPVASALSASSDVVDHWGRPFGRFETEGCLALVSYGSDGLPDEAYEATSLCTRTARTTACWGTTRDILVVNGAPLQACLK